MVEGTAFQVGLKGSQNEGQARVVGRLWDTRLVQANMCEPVKVLRTFASATKVCERLRRHIYLENP